jgi:hypothetical protein
MVWFLQRHEGRISRPVWMILLVLLLFVDPRNRLLINSSSPDHCPEAEDEDAMT